MYRKYYGLTEEPFTLSPDPRFLFLSPSHKEALAALLYGIRARRGFVALIGEVGTGKTTLLRHWLSEAGDGITAAYVFNTDLSFDDLLRTVMREWEIPLCEGRAQMLEAIMEFLIAQLRAGKITALVVDEAQNLPVEILEQLRMLSNLETTREKLLQIVLAGQPELENKLNRPELRQLKQRISLVSILKPLSRQESDEYIAWRLEVAGYKGRGIFTGRALEHIWKASRGIPRLINVICDNALIAGYGDGKPRIARSIIQGVVKDLDGRVNAPVARKLLPRVAVAAGVLLLAGIAAYGVHRVSSVGLGSFADLRSFAGLGSFAGRASTEEGGATVVQKAPPTPAVTRRSVAPASAASPSVTAVTTPPPAPVVAPASPPAATVERAAPIAVAAPPPPPPPVAAPSPPVTTVERAAPAVSRATPPPPSGTVAAAASPPAATVDAPSPSVAMASPRSSSAKRVAYVKNGQALSAIVTAAYGQINPTILDVVRSANPQIKDINVIRASESVVLPDVDVAARIHRGDDGLYIVHLATVTAEWAAKDLGRRLSRNGRKVYTIPVNVSDDLVWYRVLLGDFATEDEARASGRAGEKQLNLK